MNKRIFDFVKRRGYLANHIEKVATYNNADVYALSLQDEQGEAMPTGLPVFVLVKYDEFRIVEADDALSLLSKIK